MTSILRKKWKSFGELLLKLKLEKSDLEKYMMHATCTMKISRSEIFFS
jgi:hypothetical protein